MNNLPFSNSRPLPTSTAVRSPSLLAADFVGQRWVGTGDASLRRNLLAATLPFQLFWWLCFFAKLTRSLARDLGLSGSDGRSANGRFVSKSRPRRSFVLNEIVSFV